MAEAVGGQDIELIRGDAVFRILVGVNRLQFQNVGVTRHLRRNLRYAMYTGADVRSALSISQRAGSTKSVLQGTGYENGLPVAIGCSYKGRVWSKESGSIADLVRWCRFVGAKLTDDSISTDNIIQNVMVPEEIVSFPDETVLMLEWPIEILKQQEDRVSLIDGGTKISLSYFELALDSISEDRKTMTFHLEYENRRSVFVFELDVTNAYAYKHIGGVELSIGISKSETPLANFLNDYPLLIRFSDLSELDGHLLIKPEKASELSFPLSRFDAWEWDGVDVRKESLWRDGAKRDNSIQGRVARHFIDIGYDVVFDDDGPGEAADLICFKMEDEKIYYSLVHCKFSENVGGARLEDAVEVCSQAIRSGRWIWKFKDLCQHILRREQRLKSDSRQTRFLRGGTSEMRSVLGASRFYELQAQIVIAQPGISRNKHSPKQATVLAAAHSFLMDTVCVPLDVICAP